MQIEIKTDLKGFSRQLSEVAKRQLPFAVAQALTMTAGQIGLGWQKEIEAKLDRPTPFTVKSVAVLGAKKTRLVATVFVKDIAAAYLEPFVDGGSHFLGQKKGLLTPKNVPLNAYGNISKGKLASLKGKPGVFIGPVKLKNGQVVNGVWQRKVAAGGKGVKAGPLQGAQALTLLIRFTDPQPVKQHLDFDGIAIATAQRQLQPNFAKALKHAMATAR
ncbi:MAG TPA: hypothetical protein VFW13_15565 [Phenylobacterium sp.]|nr:hypothetical protein [Phenylobacterium sp.]